MEVRKLHSLNALRVIGELYVVHVHIAQRFGGSVTDPLVADVMSLFIVLSGFVATWTHQEDDLFEKDGSGMAYLSKRVAKVFPLFATVTFIVSSVNSLATRCTTFFVCSIMDIFMVGCWSFCHHIEDNERQGWYFETLVWLWAAFPFLHRRVIKHISGWGALTLIWATSVSMCMISVAYPTEYDNLKALPTLRLGEFLLGCGAARMVMDQTKLPPNTWMLIISLVTCGCMYGVDYAVTRYHPSMCAKQGLFKSPSCAQFPVVTYNEPTVPCTPMWNLVMSRYSFVWATLIWYCAHYELIGEPIRFLQWDVFKSLSSFSLQLYLCHCLFADILIQLGNYTKMCTWERDSLTIAVYMASWAFKHTVQPQLDRLGAMLIVDQSCNQ